MNKNAKKKRKMLALMTIEIIIIKLTCCKVLFIFCLIKYLVAITASENDANYSVHSWVNCEWIKLNPCILVHLELFYFCSFVELNNNSGLMDVVRRKWILNDFIVSFLSRRQSTGKCLSFILRLTLDKIIHHFVWHMILYSTPILMTSNELGISCCRFRCRLHVAI